MSGWESYRKKLERIPQSSQGRPDQEKSNKFSWSSV